MLWPNDRLTTQHPTLPKDMKPSHNSGYRATAWHTDKTNGGRKEEDIPNVEVKLFEQNS